MNNVYMTFYYECVVNVFVLNLRYRLFSLDSSVF